MNNIETLCFNIAHSYEEQKAAPIIANLINKIRQGGTYRDLYEFCRLLGIGDKLKTLLSAEDWNAYRDDYKQIAESLYDVMRAYSQDINDMAEIVQKSLNDSMGIGLKPKKANADFRAIEENILKILEDENFDLLHNEFITFGVKLTDMIIDANARLQAESGFNIVIVRRYDDVGIHNYANYSDKRTKSHGAEVCKFCKEREGTWNYEQTKKDKRVYQRHPGCSCSIDYVNNGFSTRIQNYRG